MRLLDLDLDLFLDDIANYRGGAGRLPEEEYAPWTAEEVRHFLEDQCGLSRSAPVPGRVVERHHETFFVFREFVEEGLLDEPFDIVHADAHADLGLGDRGWVYLMEEHLHLPVSQRVDPPVGSGRMDDGNFLAYAAGCRWFSECKYVHHPEGGGDLFPYHFRDFDPRTLELELKAIRSGTWRTTSSGFKAPTDDEFGVLQKEPCIPFTTVSSADYEAEAGFDALVLACSPSFTPRSADALIPVIEEYVEAI